MESAPIIIESKEKLKFVSLDRVEPGLVSVILSQELREKLGDDFIGNASSIAKSFEQVLEDEGDLYEVIFNEDFSIHVRPLNPSMEISEVVMVKLQDEADALSYIL